ncbi:MAG TPA: PAS domain S-box protein [Bacteroidota bacterium]|nr:PAS domain S-box protein [Bacteroidota bacterium]
MAKTDESTVPVDELIFRAVRSMNEGACVTDGEGAIRFATDAFAKLCGKPVEQLIGSRVGAIFSPGEFEKILAGIRKSSPGDEWRFEIFHAGPDGLRFPCDLTVRKIRDVPAGRLAYLYTAAPITPGHADDKVREAVYQIADASDNASTLDELYMSLHRIISTVMPANNFYIAIFDAEANVLSFPYFVDEVDEPAPPQKPGRGMTEYVIRKGTSLLCTLDVHEDLVRRGEAVLIGAPSAIWLGVPLIVEKEVIGAMVVQHYSDEKAYGEREQRILEFMSSQIARVIERKRSERALRLSSERYQRFLGQSFEGIWRVQFHDPVPVVLPHEEQENRFFANGYFIECNDVMAGMLGFGRGGEVCGRKIAHFMLPTMPDNRALVLKFIASGYHVKEADVHRTGSDGSEKYFLLNLIGIVENSALVELWGTQRDVTERRLAEIRVNDSEKKYRSIFEGSQDAIFVCSTGGKILDVNHAAVDLFGYPSASDVLGMHNMDALFAKPAQVEEYRKRLSQDGSIRDFEFELKRKDGDSRVVIVSASAETDPLAETVTHRGFIRDITDRRRLEEQFRQAQKMEGIGTLAGGIAHDFNNLLGIILGFTQLLEAGPADPERFSKSIETIKRAIERGSGLVRQLLTFARRADPSFHTLNANDIIGELIRMLRETIPPSITIVAELDERLPSITADHGQLHQALLNLCVNARDAILDPRRDSDNGTLTLSTASIDGAALRKKFGNALLDRYVVVTVRDDGVGMDEETRARIFEPFFTTKELGQGTGLGLSVVYGVLNSHQGYVEVESRAGIGTSFHLYFPISDALYPPVVRVSETTGELPAGSETILVVEDEEMLRDLLKTFLAGNGYTVLTAQNGEEGLELFRQHRHNIALVLSDMGLPRLGGWEMFQQMLEIDSGVRVILASGYFDPNLKMDLLKAGAKDFMQKPYIPDNILRRIREVIDAD